MSDRRLMRAARAACEELVTGLEDLGWEFDHDEPLHPPGVVTAAQLAELEAAVGALPDALVDFWLEVGGLDLSGEHPDWDEADLLPLVVRAPDGELLERVTRADGDGEPLPISDRVGLALGAGATVVAPDGTQAGFVDWLREALLDEGGIAGFDGDRPDELVALAADLPRF